MSWWENDPVAPKTGPGGFPRSTGKSEWWQNDPEAGQQDTTMGFVNKGIAHGNPLSLAVDTVNQVIRPVTEPLGLYSDQPFGGGKSVENLMRGQEMPEALGGQNLGIAASERAPETPGEWLAFGGGAGAGMAPAAPALGLGLTGATGTTTRSIGQKIVEALSSSPVGSFIAETAAGAGGGYFGEKGAREAEERGFSPHTGRIVGELLGGFGGAAGAGAAGFAARNTPIGIAARGARKAVLPFTEAGAFDRASGRVRSVTADPEAAAGRLDQPSEAGVSPARQSEDPGLVSLERLVEDIDPALARRNKQARAESEKALRETMENIPEGATARDASDYIERIHKDSETYLRNLVEEAEGDFAERMRALSPERTKAESSTEMRRILDEKLGAAKERETDLWQNKVPQDEAVLTSEAAQEYQSLFTRYGRALHDQIPEDARKFLDPESNQKYQGQESVRDVHSLYSKMREVQRQAKSRNQRTKARMAGEIADAILRDFDAAENVSAPFAAARQYSRQLNETFRQGRMGKILGYETEGGATVPETQTLDEVLGRSDTKGVRGADEVRTATGGDQASERAMRDYILDQFNNRARTRTGEFDPDAANRFLTNNRETLDQFPELRREISEAVEKGRFAQHAGKQLQEGLDEIAKSPEGVFIRSRYNEELEKALRAERNPEAAARALRQRVAQDPSGKALRGLKDAAVNFVVKRAEKKGGGLDPTDLRDTLRKNPALRTILDDDDMMVMDRVARELEQVQAKADRSVGELMNDMPNNIVSMLGRTMAARVGAQAGSGTSGASLLTAHFASQRVRNWLHSLTNDKAARMVADAMRPENRELLKALLVDVSDPRAAQARAPFIERKLLEYISAQAGLTGAPDEAGGGDDRQSRAGPRQDITRALAGRAPGRASQDAVVQALSAPRRPAPFKGNIAAALAHRKPRRAGAGP